jgi:IS1 family transposase
VTGESVANFIGREKQIQILRLLSEGNSIRSTERLTGIHRDTIMRAVVRFGNQCRDFLDASLANLSVRNLELDEIWTYVAKKQKRCRGNDLRNQAIGDQYLYTALDADSKMVITFAIGKRTSEVTAAFVADLEKRIVRQPSADADDIPQISTDGWGPYMPSIARSFGRSARHGVLIKQYVDPSVGRYAPPDLVRTERINIRGIKDLGTICTSHVERLNGSIRLFMKRFTRLTYAFSKKLENLAAATALHVAVYNYVRIHRSLGCTPAMAAGVIGELWDMDRLFDAVTEHANRKVRDARLEKLIERLSGDKRQNR